MYILDERSLNGQIPAMFDQQNTKTFNSIDQPHYAHTKTFRFYHDWVTRLGIVVIASQYCSMNGMMSMSLLNIILHFPSLAAVCCKLAMAVVHI